MSPLDSWLVLIAAWFLALHFVLYVLGVRLGWEAPFRERMDAEWLERIRREQQR